MNSPNFKHYSVETGIIFLLIFLTIAGVVYNLAAWNEPNFNICPLCEEEVSHGR
jgi:hypothetical protein